MLSSQSPYLFFDFLGQRAFARSRKKGLFLGP